MGLRPSAQAPTKLRVEKTPPLFLEQSAGASRPEQSLNQTSTSRPTTLDSRQTCPPRQRVNPRRASAGARAAVTLGVEGKAKARPSSLIIAHASRVEAIRYRRSSPTYLAHSDRTLTVSQDRSKTSKPGLCSLRAVVLEFSACRLDTHPATTSRIQKHHGRLRRLDKRDGEFRGRRLPSDRDN